MPWTWPGGSSPSRPSTTSSSCRSRSACPLSSRGSTPRWVRHHREEDLRLAQVLRQALHDQLRARAGHRHRPGVPVRDELVGLLPVRRRHLRRAAGDRGAARVLPRVDVPGPVDLRLGQAAREAARRDASGSCTSARVLSAYFILAANSFMQNPVGYRLNPARGRAELTDFVAVLTNKVQLRDLPARHHRGLHGRRRASSWACALHRMRRRERPIGRATPQRCTAAPPASAPSSPSSRAWASPSPATSRARS